MGGKKITRQGQNGHQRHLLLLRRSTLGDPDFLKKPVPRPARIHQKRQHRSLRKRKNTNRARISLAWT